MSIVQALRFPPGKFLGDASVCMATHGVSVSHRIADRDPDDVPIHTHEDAHFILVTGGDYVSTAIGSPPEERPVLVYNPPGTTFFQSNDWSWW